MSESGVAVIANIENACFPLGLSAVKACHAGKIMWGIRLGGGGGLGQFSFQSLLTAFAG